MKALLKVHPVAVLDELFAGDATARREGVRLLRKIMRYQAAVLDVLQDDVLLAWCSNDPAIRYPLAASVATIFKRPNDQEPYKWTPIAGKLLAGAPDPQLVVNEIVERFYPSSWAGSLATKLEEWLALLDSLPTRDDEALTLPIAVGYKALEGDGSLAAVFDQLKSVPTLSGAPYRLLDKAKPIAAILAVAALLISALIGASWGAALGIGIVVGMSALGIALAIYRQMIKPH
jgi:hypothetical protein